MNLLELQRRMFEDVRRPLTSDFAMQQKTEDGRSISELAESYVKPNDRLTSFERLEIYNRQYWFRTIAAVSEDFPGLAAVLGSKRFDSLVLAYLKKIHLLHLRSAISGGGCRAGLKTIQSLLPLATP